MSAKKIQKKIQEKIQICLHMKMAARNLESESQAATRFWYPELQVQKLVQK